MMIPPELERQYNLIVVPGSNAKKLYNKMREIKSDHIGSLITV
jgi:hypothetical protein